MKLFFNPWFLIPFCLVMAGLAAKILYDAYKDAEANPMPEDFDNCDVNCKLRKTDQSRKKDDLIPDWDNYSNPNLCTVCHKNYVDSANGYDTCESCLRNI